jgi:hypothetical protein
LSALSFGLALRDPAPFEEAVEQRIDGIVMKLLLRSEHCGLLLESVTMFGALEEQAENY